MTQSQSYHSVVQHVASSVSTPCVCAQYLQCHKHKKLLPEPAQSKTQPHNHFKQTPELSSINSTFYCIIFGVRGGGKPCLHTVNFITLRYIFLNNYKFYSLEIWCTSIYGFLYLFTFSYSDIHINRLL